METFGMQPGGVLGKRRELQRELASGCTSPVFTERDHCGCFLWGSVGPVQGAAPGEQEFWSNSSVVFFVASPCLSDYKPNVGVGRKALSQNGLAEH